MAIRTFRSVLRSSFAVVAPDPALKKIEAILAQHPIVQS
jgi:hypothetical protein